MTERDPPRLARRGAALRESAEPRDARRPGPPRSEPVLFWAERDGAFYLRATAISSLLMVPVAFFLPAMFVLFVVFLSLSSWINARLFRFEVGSRFLTLRQSLLLPRMRIPLAEIVSVQTRSNNRLPLLGGSAGTGMLVLTLRGGRLLPVPGLKDVREAAEAIRAIQAGRVGPSRPPPGGDIGPGSATTG